VFTGSSCYVLRRGLIVYPGPSTAAASTAAAHHNNRDPYGVADDHHRRSIQYTELDDSECHVRHHQSGDSAGRYQHHAAEWPGVGNACPDDNVYAHSDRAKWHGNGNCHCDRESGGSDGHVDGFADRSIVWRLVHADLVHIQCHRADNFASSGFGFACIRQRAGHEHCPDYDLYRNRDRSWWNYIRNRHSSGFASDSLSDGYTQHNFFGRDGNAHVDSE